MSDLENKLRSLAFREPPQDLRRRVLAAAPAARTWRDWFWPSPIAWAAVAAIWLIAIATAERPQSASPQMTFAQHSAAPRFLQTIDIDRIFSQP
jgi:hypothetical protein